jgi:hypothetical protein
MGKIILPLGPSFHPQIPVSTPQNYFGIADGFGHYYPTPQVKHSEKNL